MTFDTGTWWLITIILTALLGCIGALVSRSIFKSLDEHSSDIKEVRENYTTRKDHKTDIDAVRREMKEVRSEMRTEIQTLSEDIKEVKETCLRKDVFEHMPSVVEFDAYGTPRVIDGPLTGREAQIVKINRHARRARVLVDTGDERHLVQFGIRPADGDAQ